MFRLPRHSPHRPRGRGDASNDHGEPWPNFDTLAYPDNYGNGCKKFNSANDSCQKCGKTGTSKQGGSAKEADDHWDGDYRVVETSLVDARYQPGIVQRSSE
jgi:hypothetical protein